MTVRRAAGTRGFLNGTLILGLGHMQIFIAILAACLTVGLVAFGFSAGYAQAGFCAYQYNHCIARCASREL